MAVKRQNKNIFNPFFFKDSAVWGSLRWFGSESHKQGAAEQKLPPQKKINIYNNSSYWK